MYVLERDRLYDEIYTQNIFIKISKHNEIFIYKHFKTFIISKDKNNNAK